jgi:uncharacterized protein (TIGR01244 family)
MGCEAANGYDGSLLRGDITMRRHVLISALLATLTAVVPVLAQKVTKQTVAGVTNFARLESTVACAGATTAAAVPEIKKLGFASIINLREASEAGASVDDEAAAAKTAGIRFFHVPFNGGKPEAAAADKFLDAITAKGSEPAFIHCAGGNRAAAMWMIKRLAVDHWDADKAAEEATALGLTSPALKQFAIDYSQTHQR